MIVLIFRDYSQKKKLNVTTPFYKKKRFMADEEKVDITNCTFPFLGTVGTVLHPPYS